MRSPCHPPDTGPTGLMRDAETRVQRDPQRPADGPGDREGRLHCPAAGKGYVNPGALCSHHAMGSENRQYSGQVCHPALNGTSSETAQSDRPVRCACVHAPPPPGCASPAGRSDSRLLEWPPWEEGKASSGRFCAATYGGGPIRGDLINQFARGPRTVGHDHTEVPSVDFLGGHTFFKRNANPFNFEI